MSHSDVDYSAIPRPPTWSHAMFLTRFCRDTAVQRGGNRSLTVAARVVSSTLRDFLSEPRPLEAEKKCGTQAKPPAPPTASHLHALVGQASACQRPLAGAFFLSFLGSGLT